MSCSKMQSVNLFGDIYDFPKEEITFIDQLEPGDHIADEKSHLYWHHMIVRKINKEQGIICVIHFFNTFKEFINETCPYKAVVRTDDFKFRSKRLVTSLKAAINRKQLKVHAICMDTF